MQHSPRQPLLPQEDLLPSPWLLDGRTQRRLLAGLLLLGVALRVVRYALPFPLWGDECMLAVNFIQRSFADMLRPLEYHQIAPLGFLWAELAAVKLGGFHTWTLHLFPTLCSLAGLLVFFYLASRLLDGWPLVLATGTLAVAYYPIRHGAEVKQYACDLLVSALLLALALRWYQRPEESRWLWWLALVVPVALVFSLPGVFVAGGVSLFVLHVLWSRRLGARRLVAAWLTYNAALVIAFGLLLVLFIQPHRTPEVSQGVAAWWREAFPPWNEPLRLPGWLVKIHFGRMFSYPIGGKDGGSTLTTLGFLAGLAVLARHGRTRALLVLALAPFALALVAAAMRRYPYGASARTMLYLAPIIILVAAVGWTWMLLQVARLLRAPRTMWLAAAWPAALGAALFLHMAVQPYKTPYDRDHDHFARWFWTQMTHRAEVVCVASDLGEELFGGQWVQFAPEYRCYMHLYSPRHRRGERPHWEAVSARHPLRCVVLSAPHVPYDREALRRWLQRMQKRYALVNYDVFPINPHTDHFYARRYEVYEFVPREEVARYRLPFDGPPPVLR